MRWLVKATPEPFVQAIYGLASPRMVFDRVYVTGDAAFVIRSHMAAGTVHAAPDALELAESISHANGVEAALSAREPQQVRLGYRLVGGAMRRGDRYTGQI